MAVLSAPIRRSPKTALCQRINLIGDHRRKSVSSAGLAVAVPGVVAVDIRGRRWFIWRCLRKGRRMRRPTQIYRIHRAWTRPIGTRFVLLRVVLVINRRLGICGVSGFPPSTVTAGGGFFEVFTCRATQCVAPTQIYRTHCGWTRPLVTRCVPFVLSGVVAVDIRGRRWFTWRCLPTGRRVRRLPRSMSSTGSTLPSAPAWVAGIAGGHKIGGVGQENPEAVKIDERTPRPRKTSPPFHSSAQL